MNNTTNINYTTIEKNSNGLPKNHPQSINQYMFSIDIQHESNHPENSNSNRNNNLSEKNLKNLDEDLDEMENGQNTNTRKKGKDAKRRSLKVRMKK